MPINRRDLISVCGGGAAGLLLSPIPWKVLDDVSIWTQNWSWIPRPPRGPTVTRVSACTLCGAGCGLKARGVGKGIYQLAGIVDHPVSRGALCPGAFGAHQLPYSPARLRTALANGHPMALEQALADAAAAVAKAHRDARPIAIAEERPGRMMSLAWRRLAAQTPNGVVAGFSTPESVTLDAYETLTGARRHSLGFDLEKAKLIVGVGAPLLDGWGTPGCVLRLWTSGQAKFWQADVSLTHTARLAAERLLYDPGQEEQLLRELTPGFTGSRRPEVEALARALTESGPAVVISAAAGPASAELNARLGAPCIVARRPAPEPAGPKAVEPIAFESIPDQSLAVLIYEASPSGFERSETTLRRKLLPNGVLIRLSSFGGGADFTLPIPAFLEATDDSAEPREARASSWTVSPALLAPPAGLTTPAAFLARVAEAMQVTPSDPEELRKEKAALLAKSARGTFYEFASGTASKLEAAEWKNFETGAVWVDDAPSAAPVPKPGSSAPAQPAERPAGFDLALIETGWRGSAIPLATKVGQEMRLRTVAGEALVNPRTASSLGLSAGDPVTVETPAGRRTARLRLEPRIRPGTVEMAAAEPGAAVIPCRIGRA